MVHLRPLPGSSRFDGDFAAVLESAEADARVLAAAGFDAIIVENFGDAPFHADDVPKATVASMARAVTAVIAEAGLPTGVNVLRNDARAALAVAAASGASFIRVNVLSGTMFTDQGPIVGRAADVAALRTALCPDVKVFADVFVKHATPPAGLTIETATRDLAERGGADAIVVSGSGTGRPVSVDDLAAAADTTDLPVYVGSGAATDSIADLLEQAAGAIVGSALKPDGKAAGAIDPTLATAFVSAARAATSR